MKFKYEAHVVVDQWTFYPINQKNNKWTKVYCNASNYYCSNDEISNGKKGLCFTSTTVILLYWWNILKCYQTKEFK